MKKEQLNETSHCEKHRLCDAAARKREIIKKAYENEGFKWNEIEQYVDENGWTKHLVGNSKVLSVTGVSYRPNLSDGFENNNGWIAKEIEFPDDSLTVFWINIENYEHDTASLLHDGFDHNDYTHWHPLPPKAPVW